MIKVHIKKIRKCFEERLPYLYISEIDTREPLLKCVGIRSKQKLYVGDFILANMDTRTQKYKNLDFREFVNYNLHSLMSQIVCSGHFKTRFIVLISRFIMQNINRNTNYSNLKKIVNGINCKKRPLGVSKHNLNLLKKLLLIGCPIHDTIESLNFSGIFKLSTYTDFHTWLKSVGESDAIDMIQNNPYEILFYKDFEAAFLTEDYFRLVRKKNARQEFIQKVNYEERVSIVKTIINSEKFELPLKIKLIFELNKYLKQTKSNWCKINTIKKRTGLNIKELVHIHKNTFKIVEDCITFKLQYEMERRFEEILKHINNKIILGDNSAITYKTDDLLQIKAIYTAINNPISIIYGQAGTGKTSTIKEIFEIEMEQQKYNPVLLAPTGKAVSRLKDVILSSSTYDIDDINIYTLHHVNSTYGSHIKGCPFRPWSVILDEQSMQDFDVLLYFLQTFSTNIGKIIFVGDKNQLQPIGNGQVFKDLIDMSTYKQTELKTIFRTENGVNINQNAFKIRNGDINITWSPSFVNINIDEFKELLNIYSSFDKRPTILCDTNENVRKINELIHEAVLSENDDNVNIRIQNSVLTGICDRNILSRSLYFGENRLKYNNWKFFVGETVMCVKNIYRKSQGCNNSNAILVTNNGGCGKIIDINEDSMSVQFGDYKHDFLLRNSSTDKDELSVHTHIRPDYAITVDKSQGSEYKNVIYFCCDNFRNSRELLYTGITRTKKMLVIVTYNNEDVISKCVQMDWKSKDSKLFTCN